MRVVRREHRDDVARLQLVHRGQVGFRIARHVVVRKASEADVEVFVNAGDDVVQMPADAGELVAVRAGHHQPADFAAAPHVEQRERHDAGTLVRAACPIMDIAGRVLAGADHQHAWTRHLGNTSLRRANSFCCSTNLAATNSTSPL